MPENSARCSLCGHQPLFSTTITEDFDFNFEEEVVKVHVENIPVRKCEGCGETYSGPDAARMEHEVICRTLGLLRPDEIRTIREGLGWTQQKLADLTGFGIASVSRWEQGRLVQNRSCDRFLQALRDCPELSKYLEAKRK